MAAISSSVTRSMAELILDLEVCRQCETQCNLLLSLYSQNPVENAVQMQILTGRVSELRAESARVLALITERALGPLKRKRSDSNDADPLSPKAQMTNLDSDAPTARSRESSDDSNVSGMSSSSSSSVLGDDAFQGNLFYGFQDPPLSASGAASSQGLNAQALNPDGCILM